MIMQPAVMALVIGSFLVTAMAIYAVRYGISILRHWNLHDGSEFQLNLERKTYLVSTIMSYTFVFQLSSLFLFIFTCDKLSGLFVGAMCAAGTLNVNTFGYPTMALKVVNFILGGAWLALNYADNRAPDYPLIKAKYLFLLGIVPCILAETFLQSAYFLNLSPNIITSCCGSLFSAEGTGLRSVITTLPVFPMTIVFYTGLAITIFMGLIFYFTKRPVVGLSFSLVSSITFIVSVAALVTFISTYVYELPTHHCPFCILQKEYHYIGYPIYLSLLTGVVGSTGVGILYPFRNVASLSRIIPAIQKSLTCMSLFGFILFAAISTVSILFSNLGIDNF